MDLIFTNGRKLYEREIEFKKQIAHMLSTYNSIDPIQQWQEAILFAKDFGKDFNIYGDDFKIEIIPRNVQGNCVLSTIDYNENQRKECEINIGFNKDELSQLINLLQTIERKMV